LTFTKIGLIASVFKLIFLALVLLSAFLNPAQAETTDAVALERDLSTKAEFICTYDFVNGTQIVDFGGGNTVEIYCRDFYIINKIYDNRRNTNMEMTYEELQKIIVVNADGRVTDLTITGYDGDWGEATLREVGTFVGLAFLERLNLSSNRLKEFNTSWLPASIIDVDLSSNELAFFGTSEYPITLEVLFLDHNELEDLDESSDFWTRTFRMLALSHNEIYRFPDGICGDQEDNLCQVCPQTCIICPQKVENEVCDMVPVSCRLSADPESGNAPLEVELTLQGSEDTHPVDLDFGDGSSTDSFSLRTISHTYESAGTYNPILTVASDSDERNLARCSTRVVVSDASTEPDNQLPVMRNYSASCNRISFEMYDPDLASYPELFMVDVYLVDGTGKELLKIGRFTKANGSNQYEIVITAANSDIPWPTTQEVESLVIWARDYSSIGELTSWRQLAAPTWDRSSCNGNGDGNDIPEVTSLLRSSNELVVTVADKDVDKLGREYKVDVYLNDHDHRLMRYEGSESSFSINAFNAEINWPDNRDDDYTDTVIVWLYDIDGNGDPAPEAWVGPIKYDWDRAISCDLYATLYGLPGSIPISEGVAPLSVSFSYIARTVSSATGTITGTRIDFGDGKINEPAEGTYLDHTYSDPGEYRAILTVNDSSTCTTTMTVR
jgi:PKD repeat protein